VLCRKQPLWQLRAAPNVTDTPATVHITGMSAQHVADRSGPPILVQWGVEFTDPTGDRARITYGMSAADRRDAIRDVKWWKADQNPTVVCRAWECTSDWRPAVVGERD